MLAAWARGLGTVRTTFHLRHEHQAAELLGIPFGTVMQAALIPDRLHRWHRLQARLLPPDEHDGSTGTGDRRAQRRPGRARRLLGEVAGNASASQVSGVKG
jgi:hypothetical protein